MAEMIIYKKDGFFDKTEIVVSITSVDDAQILVDIIQGKIRKALCDPKGNCDVIYKLSRKLCDVTKAINRMSDDLEDMVNDVD